MTDPNSPDTTSASHEQDRQPDAEVEDLDVPQDDAEGVAGGATTLVGYGTFHVGKKH